ncbi:selenocysteine-specific translation elongation factor [Hydrogenivirga sp. 128-5-R1-1]|uniref:selenocysteine-specific translation elongation factor n=1 Tax=Hydrogenivirga sp. 128-5-R1-1 TaxID=392423 RepID=UPI00015EF9BE|nr:selenocysteine-specific translation elongation factor [Hydrogenivirga sp. 128-5-R1-1]EDP75139.1 elongation factor SelB [Hydrogenivirga sp. 128-5-R1-1]
MKFVLFATAGHVDHGKTSLIRALTGIDTDRLPEEKRRGLTIDLGFAYLDFPEEGLRLELIDVPGHERFIRNSVAGLSSVSGILLVVDAGEGVMPQTREHLSVAKLLGIKHGVAVLTKIDKVEGEILELAEDELRNFLGEEDFELPVVKVSSLNGEGLELLRDRLREEALKALENKEELPLRVLVDSAFVVKGYGTVIRGSCVEGKVREGDRVVVEPLGVVSKIRKIQNHGKFVREAQAGERVALNLPDVNYDEVKRGFWVLKPGSYIKSGRMVVRSESLLKPGRLYSFFFGMREVRGRLSHVGEGIFILRLEEGVVARRGDRAVVLDPTGRLAGGVEVIHPYPRVLKKSFIKENAGLLLESYEEYLLREMGPVGLSGELFRKLTGRAPNTGILERVSVKVGDRFYSKEFVEHLKKRLELFIKERIGEEGYGVPKAELTERFGLSNTLFEYIISSLKNFRLLGEHVVDERNSDLTQNADFIRLKELLREGIREEREILSAGVPKEVLSLSIKRRHVHRLGEFLIISEELLRHYEEKLRTLGEGFTVQEAKKATGLTRKFLIPLLEHLDFLGMTERKGDRRVWRR